MSDNTVKPTRSGLRLIVTPPKAIDHANSTEANESSQSANKPALPKSNLGKFMTAYADAIDQDVKTILGL